MLLHAIIPAIFFATWSAQANCLYWSSDLKAKIPIKVIYDDVNSMDGVDIMNSMNSVDSVEEAVVIDGDDDEIVDIPSGALTIGLTL